MRGRGTGAGIARALPLDVTTTVDDSVSAVLREDHRRLEGQLASLIRDFAPGCDPRDLRDAWGSFELGVLAHMHAEEVHLFRAFRHVHPKETQELLDEHERLRAHLTELSIALDLHCLDGHEIRDLAARLGAHAVKEERLLYPWAADRLGHVVRSELLRAQADALGPRPP
ncbi:MAG: hemerythrin domain-containing protein [Pseudomonadota bacterium]